MKQFILHEEPKNNLVELSGDDYKYLVKVRRLAVGEQFPALLPNGSEALIKIIAIDKKLLTGKILNSFSSAVPLCRCVSNIILFQALPKGDKMDLIVRQAAESGITEIVPFVSEFSVAKKSVGEQKLSRWERIVKEARQQSGSKTATSVRKPLSIKELLDYWNHINNNAVGLLFHHIKGVENNSLHGYLNSIEKSASVVLVIGPEGGFSEAETTLFTENGFKPFTIGDTILRTETAALFCTAAVKIILLENDSWQLK